MNKHLKKTILPISFLLVGLFMLMSGFAQVKYSNKNAANLTVSGTSTLHDWDMKSTQGSCEVFFTFNAAGAITGMTGLNFSTPALALKSGHGAMDKNAYKALKTDKNATVSFTANSATITPLAVANDYLVKTTGKLSIAGTSIDAEITAHCKVNSDKSITVMGSRKISMKEYGMVPPSFMMGTIKTGNDVTLKFDLTLNK